MNHVKFSQSPGIDNFQPQLSFDQQCTAQIIPGQVLFTRRWVKIGCAQYFDSGTVICESQATTYVPPNSSLVNPTIYANIKYIKNNKSRIVVTKNYCKGGWYHMDNKCYRIFPFAGDECDILNDTFLTYLKHPPFVYIAKYFQNTKMNKQRNLFLCHSNTTTESLAIVHGLYQCNDLTLKVLVATIDALGHFETG